MQHVLHAERGAIVPPNLQGMKSETGRASVNRGWTLGSAEQVDFS